MKIPKMSPPHPSTATLSVLTAWWVVGFWRAYWSGSNTWSIAILAGYLFVTTASAAWCGWSFRASTEGDDQ